MRIRYRVLSRHIVTIAKINNNNADVPRSNRDRGKIPKKKKTTSRKIPSVSKKISTFHLKWAIFA